MVPRCSSGCPSEVAAQPLRPPLVAAGSTPGPRVAPLRVVDPLVLVSPFLVQTLYNVRAEILPPAGTEHCRTGSLCSLEVSITRLSDLLDVDKDEALTESDEYFSTKLMYEGRSADVFSPDCWAALVREGMTPSLPQSVVLLVQRMF